eukprot:364905-Chlamydomonas_euryale.AAC.27
MDEACKQKNYPMFLRNKAVRPTRAERRYKSALFSTEFNSARVPAALASKPVIGGRGRFRCFVYRVQLDPRVCWSRR